MSVILITANFVVSAETSKYDYYDFNDGQPSIAAELELQKLISLSKCLTFKNFVVSAETSKYDYYDFNDGQPSIAAELELQKLISLSKVSPFKKQVTVRSKNKN